MEILSPAILCFLGLLFTVGAMRKWKWLIDPDEGLWLFYGQAAIKKFFGKRILLYTTYAFGVGFTFAGALMLIASLIYR
jgi:hypothetical protein